MPTVVNVYFPSTSKYFPESLHFGTGITTVRVSVT